MPKKLLTDEQFKQCEQMRAEGKYHREIAEAFCVSESCIKARFERAEKPRMLIVRDRSVTPAVETNTENQIRRKAAVTKFFSNLNIGDTVRVQEGACEKKHKDRKVQGKVIYKDKNKFVLEKKIEREDISYIRESFDFNYLMMDAVKAARRA